MVKRPPKQPQLPPPCLAVVSARKGHILEIPAHERWHAIPIPFLLNPQREAVKTAEYYKDWAGVHMINNFSMCRSMRKTILVNQQLLPKAVILIGASTTDTSVSPSLMGKSLAIFRQTQVVGNDQMLTNAQSLYVYLHRAVKHTSHDVVQPVEGLVVHSPRL